MLNINCLHVLYFMGGELTVVLTANFVHVSFPKNGKFYHLQGFQ